ncbi:hypothetical protein OIU93_04845 [Paeniglutamicibacter sp. ZC-3]|uniref:PH-like domain-containing protein n=1 Tax=Paeniglutamicibacter sp. ZC-3 TaxID=2986919 RepID=UPI0021F6FAEF|nr:hypothetical protein [Paeniglutamicibacter sp. ZC-3]MCV9993626.1 hypothetical protein [Paeniglutamicibacter sp. ZC-3]
MGQYTAAVVITLAIVVLMVALILLGWRNRLRRQASVPAPSPVPEDADGTPALGAQLGDSAEGIYVCTTTAGDWLDRIAAHRLGIRTNADLSIHAAGVLLARRGASDLFIPAHDLTGVSRASGMAGKFVEKDGLLVISWMLGTMAVDTGFRPRYHQELPDLAARIAALAGTGTNDTQPPAETKENQ